MKHKRNDVHVCKCLDGYNIRESEALYIEQVIVMQSRRKCEKIWIKYQTERLCIASKTTTSSDTQVLLLM